MIKEFCDECGKEIALGGYNTLRVDIDRRIPGFAVSRERKLYVFCCYECFEKSVTGGGVKK
ncbi:MAG: hypothetical protein PHS46_08430 [Candidatus Omnitrophica bacterium]|nr:hypothetical protein [Candidatus Omnitrophota bacterium]